MGFLARRSTSTAASVNVMSNRPSCPRVSLKPPLSWSTLRQLAAGRPAAQATVGRGPTELVLEARGPDVLLSLLTLAPPARMLASGLLLDSARLWSAAAAAARNLAADLVRISPALAQSPLLRRLRGASPRPP